MTRLLWDSVGSRNYEAGVDRGVLFPAVGPGVPWNGLISVNEATEDAGERVIYVDGQKYVTRMALGTFAAQIEAFTYPAEFAPYDGLSGIMSGQPRKNFGLSYRSGLGNDTQGLIQGYLLHLVYNAKATPTDRTHNTMSSAADLGQFTWDLSTTPVDIPDFRSTSHLVIDTRYVLPVDLAAIETMLYGDSSNSAYLPSMATIFALFETNALYKIVDHGDGTWTATGPASAFTSVDANFFVLDWPAVQWLDADTYEIRSF